MIMTHFAGEPSLEDVLDDPIIQAVMARDAIDADDVRRLVDDARRAYRDEAVGE